MRQYFFAFIGSLLLIGLVSPGSLLSRGEATAVQPLLGPGCGAAAGAASCDVNSSLASADASLQVSNSPTYGAIITDSSGRALYVRTNDLQGMSTCNDACAQAWPPLLSVGETTVSADIDPSLVGATMRADGSSQVTLAGQPLYYFVRDMQAGDTNGEGVVAFGGTWYLVSPSGTQVLASSSPPVQTAPAPAASAPLPSAGGGGNSGGSSSSY